VKDTIPVTLEGGTVIRFVVQVGASLGIPASHSVRGKAFIFDLFELLAGKVHINLSDTNVIAMSR
jgi:hypothetical protein